MSTDTDRRMTELIASSYRNFHARGLDYICLERNALRTVKVYFFDKECAASPEVVNPHDHRYDFAQSVVAGSVEDWVWTEAGLSSKAAYPFNRFAFDTPLLGGGGFVFERGVGLHIKAVAKLRAGDRYVRQYSDVHTLAYVEAGTVLMQWQHEDVVPPHVSTHMYSRSPEPPSLSGLYEKHTPDQVVARLRQLHGLLPEALARYGLEEVAGIE